MKNDLTTDERPAPSLLVHWAGVLIVVAVLVGVASSPSLPGGHWPEAMVTCLLAG